MKIFGYTALLIFVFCRSHAQTLSGRVYRGDSDTTVASASVYYSGTMLGTSTNTDGTFQLPAKQQQVPVVVSCIGYYSSTVKPAPGRLLIIRLKPKTEELHSVTIRVDGMDRKDEVALFTREFIGVSEYALSCTIKNIDDVNLFYNKKTGVLTADCDKAIIVENKKLGYNLTYHLERFVRTPKSVFFAGSYIFKEMPVLTVKEQAGVLNNREDVYDGSRMQFIRGLWKGTLKQAHLKMYSSAYLPLAEKDVLIDSLGDKYIKWPGKLFIARYMDNHLSSAIEINADSSFIDKDGYYSADLKWLGPIGRQRVGDLLPFEYQSQRENHQKPFTDPIVDKPAKTKEVEFADAAPRSKHLTEDERRNEIFKRLVLTPDNPLNNELVVKKWNQPVSYRLAGSCGDTTFDKTLHSRVKALFSLISRTTGTEVSEAAPDDYVNYSVLIGKLAKFNKILSPDAKGYFNSPREPGETRSGFYTEANGAFSTMVQWINPAVIDSNDLIWEQVKAQIIEGFGFFGQIGESKSIFYRGVNYWLPRQGISTSDQYFLKTLYRPDVLPGMNEKQLAAVLVTKQL